MMTGPSLAARLARATSWLNSRLVKTAILVRRDPEITMILQVLHPPQHGKSVSRPRHRSFWQAGEAQAGDEEFQNFRGRKVSVLAKAGDGQLWVDGKHATKFAARLLEPTEMSIGGDFDPHLCDQARLVVQGAVGPFDRLLEASRGEMSESDSSGVEKAIRIERAQTACPFNGFDRRLGLVEPCVDIPSD